MPVRNFECLAIHFPEDGFWIDSLDLGITCSINHNYFTAIPMADRNEMVEQLNTTFVSIYNKSILVKVVVRLETFEAGQRISVDDIIDVDYLNPFWSHHEKVKDNDRTRSSRIPTVRRIPFRQ